MRLRRLRTKSRRRSVGNSYVAGWESSCHLTPPAMPAATMSPALWLGEVVATFELVLGPIADVVIDRFSRKAVLIDAHLCW